MASTDDESAEKNNLLRRVVKRFSGTPANEPAAAAAAAPAQESPAVDAETPATAEEVLAAPPPTPAAPDPLLLKADKMHEEFIVKPLYDMLEEAAETRSDLGAELLWRRARCHYEMATQERTPEGKKALVQKGLQLAKAALVADPESGYAWKWVGILSGRANAFLPPNLRMANAFIIRTRLDEALKRLPDDASVHLALGEWCAKVASLNLVERFFANVVFGEPPQSTYDEALSFYRKAWELRPSRYIAEKAATAAKRSDTVSRDEAQAWVQKLIDTPPGPRDVVGATLREMSII